MNRINKAILTGVIITGVLSSNILAAELEEVQNKSSEIQKQIGDSKNKLDDIKKNKDDALSEISSLDGEIGQAQLEVEQLNIKIASVQKEKTDLDSKLQVLQKQLEDLKNIINQRFRKIYMNSGNQYIELLFNSKSFSDLIDRIELLKSISKQDQKLIKEFRDKEKEVADSIKRLEELNAELNSSKEKYDNRIAELNKYKDEKNQLIQKLEVDEAAQESIIQQQEAEFKQINDKINAIQEQLKQQQLQQQNNSIGNSGQTSGSTTVSSGNMYSITGGIGYPITSPYETSRVNPVNGRQEQHLALDIGASMGSGVYSLMDGVVAYAGWMNGYGNVVVINHGELSTLYAHNSALLVSVGQTVKGGQQISVVGSTGWSTGPHIHFEVIKNSVKIDPTPYYF